MILVRLRLNNFRPYAGRHEVKLAIDSERNTTLITGATGAGKTSLFYALNWVLYGTEGIPGSLISRGIGDPQVASVELEFLHDGKRYVARRTQEVDAASRERQRSFTVEEISAGGRTNDVKNPVEFVNVVLPIYARRYFFFESERIRELARPGNETQIREAVSSVLKLKVLDRITQHLNDATKEYAKQYERTQPDTSQKNLVAAVQQLEITIEEASAHLAKAKEAAALKQVQFQRVRQKLEAFAEVRHIQAQEDAVIAKLEALEANVDQVSRDLRAAVTRSAALVAAAAITSASQILDDKRTRGEVPSGIRQQLVEDLLSHGQCICGRPLDASARRVLESRHRGGVADAVAEAANVASGNLRWVELRAQDKRRALEEGVQARARLNDLLIDAQRELEGIQEKRRGRDVTEDVAELERTMRVYQQELVESLADIKHRETQQADARAELERSQTRLANMQARSAEEAKAKELYALALRARAGAQSVAERYAADMRRLIEAETDKTFHEFHWKEEQFKHVSIGEDYRLEVIDRWGMNALDTMSDGEKQMVSLAFLTAMTHVTGEEAPVVIDMPIARLSEVPVAHIAQGLPELAKQLVLLVIDDELDSEARRALAPRIGREYLLRFDDAVGHTSIEEIR